MDISYLLMLWNFLLAAYIVYADIIRKENYFKGQFNNVHKGRMLRVLTAFNNIKLELCVVRCAQHNRCKTVNYQVTKMVCELIEDSFDENNADTLTHGWWNYGTPPKEHGGWSSWRNSTECTKRCDGGTLKQSRDCDSPKPDHGGDECKGTRRRTIECNTHQCTLVNIALNKPAKLSSDYYHFAARLGNDGDLVTRAIAEKDGASSWWEVDLGGEMEIEYIIFHAYAYARELGKYKQIVVERRTSSSMTWNVCKDLGDLKIDVVQFSCDDPSEKVRYLRIAKKTGKFIHVPEFMVYIKQE